MLFINDSLDDKYFFGHVKWGSNVLENIIFILHYIILYYLNLKQLKDMNYLKFVCKKKLSDLFTSNEGNNLFIYLNIFFSNNIICNGKNAIKNITKNAKCKYFTSGLRLLMML